MLGSGLAQSCSLPPNPSDARHELQALLSASAWPGDADAVVLAVHEAIMNSELHAGGATAATAQTDGTTVVVEVHDGGPGFDIDGHARHPPDPLAERGRGLWLISQIAHGWELERQCGRTCLRLVFQP
ncbi:MAG: ATP-binding protein [Acidimicrobiales bacterium]